MKQYIVNTFTDHRFSGTPLAICFPDEELTDHQLLQIASENGLFGTAFLYPEEGQYRLRWFTPLGETVQRGHAALGAAWIMARFYDSSLSSIIFDTAEGPWKVIKKDDLFEMELPPRALKQIPVTETMTDAFGARPLEAWLGQDLLCVMDSAETVYALTPDAEKLKRLPGELQHVTAEGTLCSCISRSFAPKRDLGEYTICVFGHCSIIPFWSRRLHKPQVTAFQASSRGGVLCGRMDEDRLFIGGQTVLYEKCDIPRED